MTHIASRFALSTLAALFVAGTAAAQSYGGTSAGTTSSGNSSTAVGTPSGTSTTAGTTAATKSTAKLARADASFLRQAAQNGLAEVESSRLALTKASHTQVKSFAQQMVDDHTKANEELKALASAKGVEVATEPSLAQKAKMKLLERAEGADFDRRYVESMGVEAHEDTLKMFQKAASGATDADVKAFAAKTVPALQNHLKMARDLKATTEGDMSASGTGSAKSNARKNDADKSGAKSDAKQQ